jgi:hypothetical protein
MAAKQTRDRRVGIIYLVGDKLWIETTPVAQALNVGDYAVHGHDHQRYWKQLMEQTAVPNAGYERFPRGRVSYNRQSSKFTFLADRCILSEKSLVAAILLQLNLPARLTETDTDNLYRCFRCSGRSR